MQNREMTPEEKALVDNNIALAQFLFQKQWAKLRRRASYGVDPDELLSQAYYGLIRAAMRYRAYGEEHEYSEESIASGQYFSVFARKSIIGQMLDHLRKIDHVHSLVRKDYKLLVENGFGQGEKSDEDAVEESGLSPERAKKVINLVHSKPVSLEDSLINLPETTLGEQLADHESNVETSTLERALVTAWVHEWESLPDVQQVIIALKYYVGMELTEISEDLGISVNAVRALHKEALLSIHKAFVSHLGEA